MDASALRGQGWTISAIARHLGHDRKTIRGCLDGERTPGERAGSRTGPLEEFAEYCRQFTARLRPGPHTILGIVALTC